MTQYATTEEKYQCAGCELKCTRREMNHKYSESLTCPRCGHPMIVVICQQEGINEVVT